MDRIGRPIDGRSVPYNDEVMALGAGYNGSMLRPPVEDELISTAICSEVMALPDAALEGDKEALGPPGSKPTLYVCAGDRLEPPALGSVIVEELLSLSPDILPPIILSRTSTTLYS
jgi:hypothetical protein